MSANNGNGIGLPSMKLESSTQYTIEEFTFEWKLNVLSQPDLSKIMEIKSAVFQGGVQGQHSWQLLWKPQLDDYRFGYKKTSYKVSLILLTIGQSSHIVNDELLIKPKISFKQQQTPRNSNQIILSGFPEEFKAIKKGNEYLGPSMYDNELFDGYVVDNEVIVCCNIQVCCGVRHSGIVKTISSVTSKLEIMGSGQETAFQVMKNALFSDEFADVKLIAGVKAISAHKIILAGRSPVFAAMFKSNMREARTNRIVINDFGPDTVKTMLEYMYTGQASRIKENAAELFQISDMYEISDLKSECELLLCVNLKIENAAYYLQLACLHKASALKAASLRFIHQNKSKVGETELFKKLINENPSLLLELYMTL